ncbi:MAG TPA: winged helix-turn-helix domain-containing protein [Kofleriaceae bacterium]|jgi:hypothetical protein|nr:winged helix-turn-helix domain-containing protein [Kofleriaceae bacterium]
MASSTWPSLVDAHGGTDTRARALAALRAAARGEPRQTDALLAEVERCARGPGHALERALAHIARAILLALDGLSHLADAELMRALHAAASELVDAEVMMELVRALGDVILVTGPGRRQLASSVAICLPPDAVIVDARSDELTVRGELRSLKRCPVVRRLLYTLARHPGRELGKDALVEAVWGHSYDPLRHDDTLKSNVLRLRRVLADSGIAITCCDPGYRLDVVDPFACVFPFDLLVMSGSPHVTGAQVP